MQDVPAIVPSGTETCKNEDEGDEGLENIAIHRLVFAAGNNKPDHNDEGYCTGCRIKSEKIHKLDYIEGTPSSLSAVMLARIRKLTVSIIPVRKVITGNSRVVMLGTNTPTTSDAKIIFAPSRKKSETVLDWICWRIGEW